MNMNVILPAVIRKIAWLLGFYFFSSYAYAIDGKIFHLTHEAKYTIIKFEWVNDMIVIPVQINGGEKLNFIVDTGTRTPIILNEKTIKDLNLPRGRDVSFSGIGPRGVVQGYTLNEVSLQLPGAEASRMVMVVLKKNYLAFNKLKNTRIHGIIGTSLFRSFVVGINYSSQELILYDDRYFEPTSQYVALPMKINDSKPVIQAQVKINDYLYETNLLVDTGFNHELMLKPGLNSPMILPNDASNVVIGRGYGGTIIGKSGTVNQVYLGKFVLDNVITSFPSLSSYAHQEHLQTANHGTIGNGMLKNFNIIMDYSHELLYIKDESLPDCIKEPALVQKVIPEEVKKLVY